MLYIADSLNGMIRKLDISTGEVVAIASGLANPYGITTDGTFLYFNQNFKVNSLKLADNSISLILGAINGYADGSAASGRLGLATGAIAFDGTYLYLNDRANGIGTAARVQSMDGIVSDGTNLFFTESDVSSRIRKITLSTLTVTTIVGNAGVGDLDGSGVTAKISGPAHITSDGTNLYFADYVNSKVKKIH